MNDGVIDASSILVAIKNEAGAEVVLQRLALGTHYVSTVNVAEVLTRLSDLGLISHEASIALNALELVPVPFSESQAAAAAALRDQTRRYGLSLGDRACLALAIEFALPVVTADRAWSQIDVPVAVVITR